MGTPQKKSAHEQPSHAAAGSSAPSSHASAEASDAGHNTPSAAQQLPPAVTAMLGALQRALQGVRLHDADHPSVQHACEETAAGAAKPQGSHTLLGFTPQGVLVGEAQTPAGKSFLPLAQSMHALDAAALILQPGVTPADIKELAIMIAMGGRTNLKGQTLAERANTQTAGRVMIIPISYAGLAVKDGERTGEGDAPVDALNIVQSLMGGITGGFGAGTPNTAWDDASLQAIATHFEEAGDAGADAWRTQMAQAAEWIETLPTAQQQPAMERVKSLVGAVSPSLRAQLLKLDDRTSRSSCRVMAAVAESLPVQEVVQALKAIDASNGTLSREAMMLCTKLSHLAQDGGSERQGHAGARVNDAELLAAMETVLKIRSAEDYSPADYRERLKELSSNPVPMALTLNAAKQTDPSATQDRVLAIALRTLSDENLVKSDNTGSWKLIEHATESLLQSRNPERLAEAAEVAQSALTRNANPRTKAAAEAFVASFTSPSRARHVVECLNADPSKADDARPLLLLGRATALENALRDPSGGMDALLPRLIGASKPEELRPLLESLAEENADRLCAVLPLLTSLPQDAAVELLRSLATGRPSQVRRVAYRVINLLAPVMPDACLLSALRDEDDEVWRRALSQLARSSDVSRSFLVQYLELRLGSVPLPRFVEAAETLIRHGDAGVTAAGAVLIKLMRQPLRASLAECLAVRLVNHPDSYLVQPQLQQWSRSLGRLVAAFVGGKKAGSTR